MTDEELARVDAFLATGWKTASPAMSRIHLADLRAEVERLRGDKAEWRATVTEQWERAEAAEAKVQQLREALVAMSEVPPGSSAIKRILTQALADTEGA